MDPILLPFVGFLVGILIGLTGVGGGATLAPLLLIFFQLEFIAVVAIDLVFSCITKSIGIIFHFRKKTIDWKVSKRLWAGSIPASLIILFFINTNPIFFSEIMMNVLCILIFISGMIMVFRDLINTSTYKYLNLFKLKETKNSFVTTIFGSLIGASVSATSVGAGAIGAAILNILYPKRLNPYSLVGTDIVHAIPVTFLAGFTYFAFGNLDLSILGLLLTGSVPGVIIASNSIFNSPQNLIRIIIGVNLIASSVFLFYFD